MKKTISCFCLLFFFASLSVAQSLPAQTDTTINNLVHTPGYVTSEKNAIPPYVKSGTGKQTLILIPGWGFDGSIFTDFVEAKQK